MLQQRVGGRHSDRYQHAGDGRRGVAAAPGGRRVAARHSGDRDLDRCHAEPHRAVAGAWARAATSPSRSCRKPCARNWSAPWGCLVTDTTIRPALCSAVAEVLETMFFLEGSGEAPERAAGRRNGRGSPDLRRQSAGLLPDASGARRPPAPIAADFLGEDRESDSPSQQSTDVTLELANMICGAVLSRIESSATFRLGAPQIVARRKPAARADTRKPRTRSKPAAAR